MGKLSIFPKEAITVTHADDVTFVTVYRDGLVGIGQAKCNPIDKYSSEVGYSIAFARALNDLSDKLEALWVSRATTKKDWKKRRAEKSVG